MGTEVWQIEGVALGSPLSDVVANSLADRVFGLEADVTSTLAESREIERHLHNYERWIAPADTSSGEDHVADPLEDVPGTAFTITSGANKAYGTAVQIFGATDAAVCLPTGRQAVLDLHRLLPVGTNKDKYEWLLRIIAGTSAAAGVSADTYLTVPLFIENTDKAQSPVHLIDDRCVAGTKLWAQILNRTDNDSYTADFVFGIHGYPE